MSVPADVLSQALNPQVNQNPAPAVAATPVVRGQIAPRPAVVKPVPVESPEQAMNRRMAEYSQSVAEPESLPEAKSIIESKTKHEKERLDEEKTLSEQYANKAKLESEYATRLEQYANKREMMGAIPEYKKTLQEQAPSLMILMSLLGKAFRVPGLAMLQGSTGMMQGLQAGDMQRYNIARQNYFDGVDQLKDIMGAWNAVYDMRMKASGDNILATKEAIEMANTAIGNDNQQLKDIQNAKKVLSDQSIKIYEASTKLREHEDNLYNRRQNREIETLKRQDKELQPVYALVKSSDIAVDDMQNLKQKMQALKDAVKNEPALRDAIFAEGMTDSTYLTKNYGAKGTKAAQALNEYSALANSMSGSILAQMTKGEPARQAGLKIVADKEIAALPVLKGKTLEQTEAAVNALYEKAIINQKRAKQNYDEIRDNIESGQPAYTIRPSTPSAQSVPVLNEEQYNRAPSGTRYRTPSDAPNVVREKP